MLDDKVILSLLEIFEKNKIDPRILTCYDCKEYEDCDFSDDLYNTDGDCLNSK